MGFSDFVSAIGKSVASAWNKTTFGTKAAVVTAVAATALIVGKFAYNHFCSQRQQQKNDYPAFEEGDNHLIYDGSLNSIPGTCFEIGAALSILEAPGVAGEKMDAFALRLSVLLDRVYKSNLGDKEVNHNGQIKTLREVFDEKLLKEIRPSSDQIGRCEDRDLEQNWYKGAGFYWLQKQLGVSSAEKNYSHHNMLTKIRMLSALGTVIRELMTKKEVNAVAALVGNSSPQDITDRYNMIVTQIRHEEFDNPITRARSERPPIINGQSVGNLPLQSAGPLGLGFGQVYGPESFQDEEEYKKYLAEEKLRGGRQGLKRENQPIDDLSRPGLLSEYGLRKMPQAFREAGLPDLLKLKAFEHGTGVNRWQVNGTHSKTGWVNGFPAAGAHSGGTVDVLLALDCLNNTTIYKDEETVLQSGLLISSFMNFGGYHSFNETFPIAQDFARGNKFEVINRDRQAHRLYSEFSQIAQKYCPDAAQKIEIFKKAYTDSFRQAKTTKEAPAQAARTNLRSWEIL